MAGWAYEPPTADEIERAVAEWPDFGEVRATPEVAHGDTAEALRTSHTLKLPAGRDGQVIGGNAVRPERGISVTNELPVGHFFGCLTPSLQPDDASDA